MLIYVLLYFIVYVDFFIFTSFLQYFARNDNNKALFVAKWGHIPWKEGGSNNEHIDQRWGGGGTEMAVEQTIPFNWPTVYMRLVKWKIFRPVYAGGVSLCRPRN